MKAAPLWLESDAIRQLLSLLVDRLDAADQRGSAKMQPVALNDKSWPALYRTPFESEKEELWGQVSELCRWGWMQVKPEAALRSCSGYALSPRLTVLNEKTVRQAISRPERVRSSVERWREAVSTHLNAPDDAKRLAGEFCIDMPDRSMVEVVQRLNRLPELAAQPLLLREVSARLFWGMSKVLDKRQGLVAAVLGVPECPFVESPIQMQVFLPPGDVDSVLFIENQMSFEQATRSASGTFKGQALVFASGFKGSARRLRSQASVYYSQRGELASAARERFEEWLTRDTVSSMVPAYFWGDLDWSGMRILYAMRCSFPGLTAWQPGYIPMRDALLRGEGHSPEASDKGGQVPLIETGCAFADSHLLPAMVTWHKFIDQEVFTL
ncbi:MAG: hypothetical protein V4724_10380 [Pseudomonadota bacterium]